MIEQQEKILFEKFKILQCVKKDLHSCVYIANHIYLGKTIFLKTLARDKISEPAILHRFQREARSLAGINHPNIIQVYDLGNFKKFFYISFEYFPSRDLRAKINEKKMSVQDKLSIFIQIIQGLAEAHKHNIIHRDIKPENILVNDHYQVKIADFGLALIRDDLNQTRQDSIVGTPGYMSPEQIMGEALTPASDLFSLGILGYELFSGNNPFIGKDAGATINNILACDIVARLETEKAIPAQINETLKQLLQKNKVKRPGNAGELLTRFNISDNHGSAIPVTSVPSQKKRGKYYFAVLVAVLLSVFAIASFFLQKSYKQIKDNAAITDTPNVATADTQRTVLRVDKDIVPANIPPESTFLQNEQPLANAAKEAHLPQLDLPGKLFVECLPWADVYIDARKIETTPLEGHISLLAGVHDLVLQHPDYPPLTKKIEVEPGGIINVSVNLDTCFGYLVCRVYPWGNVYIDSVFKGQTPLQRPITLTDGKHLITIKNNNFGKIDEYITINKIDTVEFKFNFERLVNRRNTEQP